MADDTRSHNLEKANHSTKPHSHDVDLVEQYHKAADHGLANYGADHLEGGNADGVQDELPGVHYQVGRAVRTTFNLQGPVNTPIR